MTIDELYSQIYTDETTKNSDKFIGLYEANKDLVDSLTVDADNEVHNKVMRLSADYAHHLTMKESYRKAVPTINKALGLFQTYPHFKDTDLFKIEFYETLIFDRAVANYYLKRFKEAKKDLSILTAKFPGNDTYKDWLAATKNNSTQKLIYVLWYVIAAVVIITAIVDRQDIGILYDIILYLGLAALIAAVTAELIKAARKKRIKNGG